MGTLNYRSRYFEWWSTKDGSNWIQLVENHMEELVDLLEYQHFFPKIINIKGSCWMDGGDEDQPYPKC